MEGSPRAHGMYYRCPARTLAPGSQALAAHPPTVYLREDAVQEAVNAWLGGLFAPENVDRTVAAWWTRNPTRMPHPAGGRLRNNGWPKPRRN
ncbi:hypothetical protein N8J89_20720 [Crossiella sp. CA-258035]|uniref:hypothetical protein n=1 Tax=Crossiella sp. CA-258035 TaxID=2981138 RepID=UPI0024BC2121|nr:hypothetical protein [Crossiella sp. CA-258035]WHT23592.1 hypothetical protein N8J89_20720 [Crossiella sp. CA-258035]